MRTIDRLGEANEAPLIEQAERDRLVLLVMALGTGILFGGGVGIGYALMPHGDPVAMIAAAMLVVSGVLLGILTVRFKLRLLHR